MSQNIIKVNEPPKRTKYVPAGLRVINVTAQNIICQSKEPTETSPLENVF